MNLPTAPQPTPHSRISVIFGDPILDAGHTATPNLILNSYARLAISPQEMMFIIHLLQHKWDARDPYPSLGSVARRMGVSLRQAQRYEASLVKKGYLSVHARISPERGQLSNEYNFAPLIERILTLDGPDDQTGQEYQAAAARPNERLQDMERGEALGATPMTKMSSPPVTLTSSEEEPKQTDTIIDQIDREEAKNEKTLPDGRQGASARNALAKTPTPRKNRQAKRAEAARPQAAPQRENGHGRKPARGEGMTSLKDLLASRLVIPASELPEELSEDQSASALRASHGSTAGRPVKGRRRAGDGMRHAKLLEKVEAPISAQQRPTAKGSIRAASAMPSARIAETVKRISQEFGDRRIEANTRQLMGLYHRSGMSESAFEDWLYTVRAELRERRAHIKKPMAYLYATLKNRLRL